MTFEKSFMEQTLYHHTMGMLLPLFLILASCGGSAKAPVGPDGSNAEILLVFDADIDEEASQETQKDHRTVAKWMEEDIINRFKEWGYVVTKGTDPAAFKPGKGKYLIVVKMVEYTPASATSREEAGFGAGTTIIDTYSELFTDNHTIPRFRLKKGESSARDWTYCAKQVTASIAKDLSKTMNEMYK